MNKKLKKKLYKSSNNKKTRLYKKNKNDIHKIIIKYYLDSFSNNRVESSLQNIIFSYMTNEYEELSVSDNNFIRYYKPLQLSSYIEQNNFTISFKITDYLPSSFIGFISNLKYRHLSRNITENLDNDDYAYLYSKHTGRIVRSTRTDWIYMFSDKYKLHGVKKKGYEYDKGDIISIVYDKLTSKMYFYKNKKLHYTLKNIEQISFYPIIDYPKDTKSYIKIENYL